MAAHPLQTSSAFAEEAFGFLTALGFTLKDRWVTGGESFRDGWSFTFSGPKTRVVVQYLDMQFEVRFARGNEEVTYFVLDRDLFSRRSGFHGDMFPPEKLEAAIRKIAEDVRANYEPTLAGEDAAWSRISRLRVQPAGPARLP